ncbi:MAG: hypothetical protein C5B56_04450 [Proteobacteria bacterium]|nr:MAG: hypothetical protein C5B56_04450 [Pseudomonadota bacterium]
MDDIGAHPGAGRVPRCAAVRSNAAQGEAHGEGQGARRLCAFRNRVVLGDSAPARESAGADGNCPRWRRRAGRRDLANSMSILASLTMAGLGISLLPPSCYRAEISSGKLRRLRTNPKVPKVGFSVVHLKRRNIPVMPLLVATARETSAFSPVAR